MFIAIVSQLRAAHLSLFVSLKGGVRAFLINCPRWTTANLLHFLEAKWWFNDIVDITRYSLTLMCSALTWDVSLKQGWDNETLIFCKVIVSMHNFLNSIDVLCTPNKLKNNYLCYFSNNFTIVVFFAPFFRTLSWFYCLFQYYLFEFQVNLKNW